MEMDIYIHTYIYVQISSGSWGLWPYVCCLLKSLGRMCGPALQGLCGLCIIKKQNTQLKEKNVP